jgi:ADP-heptose:LPS heptosyltransferase
MRGMRAESEGSVPDWGARRWRVLYVGHHRIGDMILATGVLRTIATSFPTITLDVLGSPENAPVLRGAPHLGSVLLLDKTKPWRLPALLHRLRRARYDVVIDGKATEPSITTLLFILVTGAGHRIGVAGRGNDAAFTLALPRPDRAGHLIEHLSGLLAAFHADPQSLDLRPQLYLSDSECSRANATWTAHAPLGSGRRLLINVSARTSGRQWPEDRYVDVAGRLVSRDPRLVVLFIGSPSDTERVTRIALTAGLPRVPTPNLRDAFALIATSDFVLTPDTSIAHAAAAFSKPAVVLYPRGQAERYGLFRAPGYELSSPDWALSSLGVEPVLDALDRLLSQFGEARPDAIARV